MVAHYNKDKAIDGIICDICGKVCTKSFIYYSSKFDRVVVNQSSGGIDDLDKRFMDLDFCESCFSSLKKKVVNVINEREAKDRAQQPPKKVQKNKKGGWTTSAVVHKQSFNG